MTRTTGRTLALLALLQSGRDWTGGELCARLEVSARTLRRDIQDLRELGYGIEAVRGTHGGYRLGAGAHIPALPWTADELIAVAIGLKLAAFHPVSELEGAAARALAKLESSLGSSARAPLSTAYRAMVPLGRAPNQIRLAAVMAVTKAIAETRTLRAHYVKRGGSAICREIEPHRIAHTADHWYLVAWDLHRNAWRTLRMDRLNRVDFLAHQFPRRAIPDDVLQIFTARNVSTAPYPYRARVRMFANAAHVAGIFPLTAAVVHASEDGTCVLEAGANSPEELLGYLVAAGIEFEVIKGHAVARAAGEWAGHLARASGAPLGPGEKSGPRGRP